MTDLLRTARRSAQTSPAATASARSAAPPPTPTRRRSSTPAYAHLVQATIARGRVDRRRHVRRRGARRRARRAHAPTTPSGWPSTDDRELAVLQDAEVAFRGQVVGLVVAETSEVARQAAELVRITLRRAAARRRAAPGPRRPVQAGEGQPVVRDRHRRGRRRRRDGVGATVTVEQTYTTAMYHNNPLEPHATTALWEPGGRRCRSPCGTPPRACTRPGRPWPRCSGWTRSRSGWSARSSAAGSGRRARRTPTSSWPRWPRGRCRAGR